MSGLKERTRRTLVSTLFLLLGPTTLFLTGLFLFWQKTPGVSKTISERFSRRADLDFQFGIYKRVRPNVELLTRVSVLSKKTKEPSFFCPEVYRIRQADSSIFASFAQSFDVRMKRGEKAPEENVGAEFSENQASPTDESAIAPQEQERAFRSYFDDARNLADRFELFVVPRVYCRSSKLNELQDEIASLTGAVDARENRAICFVVQELICQSDVEFEESTRVPDVNKEPLQTNELRSIFRTAALLDPKGDADAQGRSIDREVLAFASESPTLEHFRALSLHTREYTRIEALFELQKIACPQPCYLSWTRQNGGESYVEYDSTDVPTPVSFAANFLPSLRSLGDECYFFGNLRSSTDRSFQGERFNSTLNVVSSSQNANADARVWTTRFEAFRFCNLQIDDLCERLSLPNFTGKLVNLTLEQGALRQGVFLGAGTLSVERGSVPTKALQGLLAKGALEIHPSSAASLRFANDATPFHNLELNFKLLPSGVVLNSAYQNKIIACYQHENVKYGIFLSRDKAGAPIPYSEPISALVESQNVKTFWTPLVRDALNHLPISDAAPRNADASDSLLR